MEWSEAGGVERYGPSTLFIPRFSHGPAPSDFFRRILSRCSPVRLLAEAKAPVWLSTGWDLKLHNRMRRRIFRWISVPKEL
eukprot:scaffold3506_cov210-Pinguiococcus_pyrenoidosus.AAC.1